MIPLHKFLDTKLNILKQALVINITKNLFPVLNLTLEIYLNRLHNNYCISDIQLLEIDLYSSFINIERSI